MISIILRELVVSGLREWMASRGLRNVVQVGKLGKAKTATQMLSLIILLVMLPLPVPSSLVQSSLSSPSWITSLSTFSQSIPLDWGSMGISQEVGQMIFKMGISAFYVSAFLAVLSGGSYLQAAWPILMLENPKSL